MQPHLPYSTKRLGYPLLPFTLASLFVLSPALADENSDPPLSTVSGNDKSALELPNVHVTAEQLVSATERTANETGSVSVVDAQQLDNTVAYSA
jgi:hypothetical protein